MSDIPQELSTRLNFVRYCAYCHKGFNRELPYSRHVSYCRRAQSKRKGRLRSCANCSAARKKCSFAQPQCSRCLDKDLVCVYETPQRMIHALEISDGIENQRNSLIHGPKLVRACSASAETGAVIDNVPGTLSEEPFDGHGQAAIAGLPGLGNGQDNADGHAIDWVNFSWDSSFQQDCLTNPATINLSNSQPEFFRGDSHPILTTSSRSRSAIYLCPSTPAAEQGARLVLHVVRAFPVMMLRRQTFPPFIHPHWHTPTLPEKLSTCMSISQLFVARTLETRPFLWRSIDGEEQRFRDEIQNYSIHEIFTTMQVLIIYTIMAIVDRDGETPPRYSRLTNTYKIMAIRFIQMIGTAPFAEAEWANPSLRWEDWIFTESRRRLGCLWFVISRIVCPDSDLLCPTLKACRDKPLCTAKGMWEARSREEWETERALFDSSLLHKDLWNFGALIDANYSRDTLNTMRLDAWEANTDKLGVLLSIAISVLDKDMDDSEMDRSRTFFCA